MNVAGLYILYILLIFRMFPPRDEWQTKKLCESMVEHMFLTTRILYVWDRDSSLQLHMLYLTHSILLVLRC